MNMVDVKLEFKRHIDDFSSTEELINDIIKERFSMGEYLANLGSLEDPFSFKDMKLAVESLTKALKEGKNVCIWGDYDVDGATSVYTAYGCLLELVDFMKSKSKIGYYIPHREKEGYGINNNGLDKIKEGGYNFVISVDCGIASYNQVEYAKEIGLEFIVTDHHEYPEYIPKCPVINPHDGVYPFSKLSGCGTVFKFMEAMFIHNQAPKNKVYDYLDIVAISTVADLMDLVGENRIIVKYGLYTLQRNVDMGSRKWLNKLLEQARFRGAVDSYTIGFVIGPRINSVGRLEHCMKNLEYMLSDEDSFLDDTILFIDSLNETRKSMQDDIVQVGCSMVEESENGLGNSVTIVVPARVGVVGLAASNLTERYYRPTTVFSSSVNADIYKASARSIEGFDYYKEVIEKNRDIIVGGGGHAMAAGLAIKKENIKEFSKRVDRAVADVLRKNPNLLVKKIRVDSEIHPESINKELIRKIEQMAPFGQGNPSPTFFLRNMNVVEVKGVPKDNPKHVQVTLNYGSSVYKGIIFKRADMIKELMCMGSIDIAFTLSLNKSFGKTEINLIIEYFRPSKMDKIDNE